MVFFPDGPQTSVAVAAARQICAGCPVAAPCLEWAVAHPNEQGVWAGTTDNERRKLRRQTRAAS